MKLFWMHALEFSIAHVPSVDLFALPQNLVGQWTLSHAHVITCAHAWL